MRIIATVFVSLLTIPTGSALAQAARDVDTVADAYLGAIQAQDWMTMAGFLGPASHYQDFSAEHLGQPMIDLRGAEKIAGFWRTSAASAGIETIGFAVDYRWTAGPNVLLVGHGAVRSRGEAWGLPLPVLDTRVRQITHLRIVDGVVTYHADHVDYAAAEQQIAEQIEAYRRAHGGELPDFPRHAADLDALAALADRYLETVRDQRWDTAGSLLAEGVRYQDFSMEHFERPRIDLEGRDAIEAFFRSANADARPEEVRFDVEQRFAAGGNLFLLGHGYVKSPGAVWGLPGRTVAVRFRRVSHLRFDGQAITHHTDHVDYAAIMAQVAELAAEDGAGDPPPP